MAMVEHANAYQEEAYFEQRRLRVLSGAAAKDKANAKRIDVAKIVVVCAAVLVYCLLTTFMEGKINLLSAEINTLKADIEDVQNEALKADLTIGELSSLERIETYASTKLGMVAPAAGDAYYLDAESSARIAQGMENMQTTAEAETKEETQGSFLSAVGNLFSDYFGKTALAATGE